MKKLITTSIVLVSVASISGVAIGMSLNKPTQKPTQELISKTADVSQPTATDTTTQQTTTAAPAPSASPAPTTATSATTPTPVTVTAYEQIPLDDQGNIDCKLTYSDGTTYQWQWQTVVPHAQWVVSRNGVGTWVSTTQELNSCDISVIGTAKQ